MRFDYLEPCSIEEAISYLAKYGEKARVIAGGTDLIVQMRDKTISPEVVVDIGCIPGLNYINYDEKQGLSIGALTSIRTLETSSKIRKMYPVVSRSASQLGSVGIRNLASIGGNLCNASPAAETAPALIGLSARCRVVGPDGERLVPLEEFFLGPGMTVLGDAELLVEVQVPVPLPSTRGVHLKHGLRGTIDVGIVKVAVVMALEPEKEACRDIKIVLGSAAPTPMRARKAEKILLGKRIDEALISRAAEAASDEARPISDLRASAEYRRKMVKVFTKRAIKEAMAQ